ncbi:MAG: hypothetical protein Q9207_000889 [Kuettlingeria erythrocarpa]
MPTSNISYQPVLDIVQANSLNDSRMATLMSDIISNVITMDDAIVDLVSYTDVTKGTHDVLVLWSEASVYMDKMIAILRPLVRHLLQTQRTGSVRPFIVTRYKDLGAVTFEGLRVHLKTAWEVLVQRLVTWQMTFDDLPLGHVVPWSSRPLPEIVTDAMLHTMMDGQKSANVQQWETWLSKFNFLNNKMAH